MAATGTPTPNLGLRIPLGTDPASVDDINYNSNALDTIIGDVGETPVAGQLGAANNRISAVQAGLAIVCNGNTHAAIESGQFAYVKNHGTLAEGLYRNNTGSTIAANATLSSSNLTADSSGGLNTVYESLNGKITGNISTYGTYEKRGNVVTVRIDKYDADGITISGYDSITISTSFPAEVRPNSVVTAPIFARSSNGMIDGILLRIQTDGTVLIMNMSSSVTAVQFIGSISYVI